MTDTENNSPVRVTAKERPHPALRKLARAVIALARLRRDEACHEQLQQSASETTPAPADADSEVCHG